MLALILHSKKRNINTVIAMATREMDTPMYPIICKAKIKFFARERSGHRALSKMAKLVRWLHSQTVMEGVERSWLT